MGWIIWGVILPTCVVAAWLIVRRPIRQVVEDLGIDRARLAFRWQREGLEARFLTALENLDPAERIRWDSAEWYDQVHWARDHQTRRLLALVEIQFEPTPFDPPDDSTANHATALFEYRKGRWFADGRRIDATRPIDAFRQLGRFEPVVPPQRRS